MESSHSKQAVLYFESGLSCSQAIVVTYAPLFGISQEDAIRMSRAFGGGMGHLSETCGAVTGAFMVIGIQSPGVGMQIKEETYCLVQKFAEKFKIANNSLNCTQLLGCDLGTSDGRDYYKEQGRKKSHCTKYIENSAHIIEEILLL